MTPEEISAAEIAMGIDDENLARLGFFPTEALEIDQPSLFDTDSTSFSNYSGRTQDMEMRKPAFAASTKVLLVDQWIETGGTMDGAIRLIEQQGGTVVGLVAIAMEDNAKTTSYRQKFPCVTAVLQDSDIQQQCNRQYLDSFTSYDPSMAFPKIR